MRAGMFSMEDGGLAETAGLQADVSDLIGRVARVETRLDGIADRRRMDAARAPMQAASSARPGAAAVGAGCWMRRENGENSPKSKTPIGPFALARGQIAAVGAGAPGPCSVANDEVVSIACPLARVVATMKCGHGLPDAWKTAKKTPGRGRGFWLRAAEPPGFVGWGYSVKSPGTISTSP